jgi:hypothetical protein
VSASRVPNRHRRRPHRALLDALASDARATFARAGQSSWDPTRRSGDGELDLGRGLLDSFALALHVLWTYQQAWAEETFLATARLDGSIDKLLGHVGYWPRPGVGATGVIHLRARAGAPGVVARGFQLLSAPRGEEPEATYETLAPVRVDPLLNELRGFVPPADRPEAPPPMAGTPSEEDGEPTVPVPPPLGQGSALGALQDRLDAARHGPIAARRAARAKIKARNLAKTIDDYDLGADGACQDQLDALCAELCAAQDLAAQETAAAAAALGTLSESQEIIARQLRLLAKRQADAVTALEGVLARGPGETDAAYAKRLDQMTAFLDAFVGGMIQEARDQLVLLRGPQVLSRLDQTFGGPASAPARGTATAGLDAVYLPPVRDGDVEVDPPLQLGDHLVVGEEVSRTGADGRPVTERRYHAVHRVVRITREIPRGETAPMMRVQLQPPLARSYDLDRTFFLGNIAPISHGKAVVEHLTAAPDGRTARLGTAPLTWLRSPTAARGRAPELALTVAGRPWKRVDDLLSAGPDEAVFAVEPAPGGGHRLRFGDGDGGARLPAGARLVASYRTGLGLPGDRGPGRVTVIVNQHPSVESAFNPLPLEGGADAEARSGARDLGPTAVGAIDRAISLPDVVALARGYDGVARARATRDPRRPHQLAVVVSGPDRAELPQRELDALALHLRLRVPPGLEVLVENRLLVPVRAALTVRYQRGADPIAVVREVRARLGVDATVGLLSAARVDLGDDLAISALYEATDGVPGLHSIVVRELYRADEPPGLRARIVTRPREVLAWAEPADGSDGVSIAYEEGHDL